MKIQLTLSSQSRRRSDLLVAGVFEGQAPKSVQLIDNTFSSLLKQSFLSKRFEGKLGQTLSTFSASKFGAEILAVGLGAKKKYQAISARKIAGQIYKEAIARKAKTVKVLLDSFSGGDIRASEAVEIVAEVMKLAAYRFDRYKSKKDKKEDAAKELSVEILYESSHKEKNLKVSLNRAGIIAEGVMRARDFGNEPANVLNPERLAKEAKAMAASKKLSCQVIGPSELKRLGMGGILGVNQGSVTDPALIILEHGKQYKNKGTVCLVGKGVTFDTGGISIKPSKDMDQMKYDMCGAAAVIAAMGVIADLKLPKHVVCLAPAVENNVANNPQRPGDIIKMYNGKTVEVLNTDAQERLILADALAYAAKYQPKMILDFATLTGLCVYTFSDKASGLLGNREKLNDRVKKAGEKTGERCWELPLWDDYAELIKGNHSDLANIGGAYGGTITAAMFLKEFVPEKTAWAHLDIAGTAWCNAPRYDCAKGATGVGVRLIVELLS